MMECGAITKTTWPCDFQPHGIRYLSHKVVIVDLECVHCGKEAVVSGELEVMDSA
tara:strand:- start:338 stop:502 length:165 start_codon:yes stop_codon:yes gene_type:complete